MINSSVKSKIETELWDGERLLWADKSRKLVLHLMDKSIVGFSIFWLILVSLMFLPQLFSGQDIYEITINGVLTEVSFAKFLLFFLLFPAFGIAMLVFVFGAAKIRTGQIYAVTDKRSLLVSSFIMHRVTSIPHGRVIKIQKFGNNDLGSLEFQKQEESKWVSFNPDWFLEMKIFSGISNPKIVEELIMSLQIKEKLS